MAKLTGDHIIKILQEQADDNDDLKNNFGHNDLAFKSIVIDLGLGETESVHSDREGSSYDTMVTVQHFKDHNVYISLSGYYSSQNGTEWDGDFKQVYPKTKMITVYETDPHTFYGPII